MPMDYMNGKGYRDALVAGADWVRHNREYINQINVFPVPDGDTGTNMALSLSATAAAVRDSEDRDISCISKVTAEASIMGAKGNSGMILAHWFQGLSLAFGSLGQVNPQQLARALGRATRSVYDALEEPVEGTILTVMRGVGEQARKVADGGCDFLSLMDEMVEAAKIALARTPEQLAVLRQANVVDAGAQGYLDFLKGARRALRGEPIPVYDEPSLHGKVEHSVIAGGEASPERFCTELVVRGKNFDTGKLRSRFRPMGSCLSVASTGSVFKLHVHTNRPDEVMKIAAKLGVVQEFKADDMWRQQKEFGTVQITPLIPLDQQPATVAILCDSTADLPADIRRDMGIESAPLQIMFGDDVFRDQVDLSSEEFYRRLESDPRHPTTSQPPAREFVDALDRIRQDREALVLTVSSRLSGTFRSAQSAARLAEHPRVEVFDTGSASLGHGLMTLNAARLAARGVPMNEILTSLERWRSDSGLLFSLTTLEYLRRGGRIGAAQSMIGKLFGFQPILGFEDGNVVPLAKGRGSEDALNKVTALLAQRLPEGSRVRIGMVEIGHSSQLDQVTEWLKSRCQVVELIRGTPTGVIGVHAGPGGWGLFYQLVRDDDPLLT
ncbi:MAG: DegV family protein [bacterium]|nr:DegV family protein [bacterium]